MTQKSVRNILANKLDLTQSTASTKPKRDEKQLPLHENVRGSAYYH